MKHDTTPNSLQNKTMDDAEKLTGQNNTHGENISKSTTHTLTTTSS